MSIVLPITVKMCLAESVQSFPLMVSGDECIRFCMDTAIQPIAGEHYQSEYVVTPRRYDETVLETEGLFMDDDVTVLKVPYYVTSNESGGETAYIAQEA